MIMCNNINEIILILMANNNNEMKVILIILLILIIVINDNIDIVYWCENNIMCVWPILCVAVLIDWLDDWWLIMCGQ